MNKTNKIDPNEYCEDFSHNKDSWRVFRMISEFVEGFEKLSDLGPSVSIFGSSRTQAGTAEYELATSVAQAIAKKGLAIITGGGPGIMEAANKGAQSVNMPSCGLCINLPFEDRGNPYIDNRLLLEFRYFFVRKVMFVKHAQAFVVLPGGLGTLDEFFEALTLIQTQKIRPFPIYLVGTDYWTGLIQWLKEVPVARGALSKEDLDLFKLCDDPEEIANGIEKHYRDVLANQ